MTTGPGHPRCESLDCLQEAGGAAPECKGRLQQLALAAIRGAASGELTAHETSLATGIDRHSIQPRISELLRKGLMIPDGKRRRNPSGRTATVWIASEHVDGVPQSPVAT